MEITLICASKEEHVHRGHPVYSLEFTNTEEIGDGLLHATFHLETADPEMADRFGINESYSFQIPD
ncbi:MAG: hypothetical protein ABEJ96_07025 [Thiohalorhabdaceae bacterium]